MQPVNKTAAFVIGCPTPDETEHQKLQVQSLLSTMKTNKTERKFGNLEFFFMEVCRANM